MKALLLSAMFTLATYGYTTKSIIIDDDAILAGFIQFYLEKRAEPLSPAEMRAKYIAWDLLCFELRDVDCTGVVLPKVQKFQPNPLRPGLAGYYNGSDTIFIRSTLTGEAREEVLAHEMSHYLDVTFGITNVPGYAEEICFSEKRAWAVSDAYWTKYLRPSKVVGESWANWYRHCTPLKDKLYPKP